MKKACFVVAMLAGISTSLMAMEQSSTFFDAVSSSQRSSYPVPDDSDLFGTVNFDTKVSVAVSVDAAEKTMGWYSQEMLFMRQKMDNMADALQAQREKIVQLTAQQNHLNTKLNAILGYVFGDAEQNTGLCAFVGWLFR